MPKHDAIPTTFSDPKVEADKQKLGSIIHQIAYDSDAPFDVSLPILATCADGSEALINTSRHDLQKAFLLLPEAALKRSNTIEQAVLQRLERISRVAPLALERSVDMSLVGWIAAEQQADGGAWSLDRKQRLAAPVWIKLRHQSTGHEFMEKLTTISDSLKRNERQSTPHPMTVVQQFMVSKAISEARIRA